MPPLYDKCGRHGKERRHLSIKHFATAMRQRFKLSKKIDASSAGRVLYALEEGGIFQYVHISLTTGFLEIDSNEIISVEQVGDLLKNIREINIEEIKTK